MARSGKEDRVPGRKGGSPAQQICDHLSRLGLDIQAQCNLLSVRPDRWAVVCAGGWVETVGEVSGWLQQMHRAGHPAVLWWSGQIGPLLSQPGSVPVAQKPEGRIADLPLFQKKDHL